MDNVVTSIDKGAYWLVNCKGERRNTGRVVVVRSQGLSTRRSVQGHLIALLDDSLHMLHVGDSFPIYLNQIGEVLSPEEAQLLRASVASFTDQLWLIG